MIYLSCWHSILTFETLVSNSWEIHVGSLFCNFDTLELSVMEIVCVVDVFYFCWVNFLFQHSEVIFTKFSGVLSLESVLNRVTKSNVIFSIDRFASRFGKTLSIEILTGNLRYVTSVSRDMLSLNISVRSSNPIDSFHRSISVLKGFSFLILSRWLNEIIILFIVWLGDSNINIIFGWLLSGLSDNLINVSSSTSEDLILFWNVTSVPWKIIFVVVDEGFGRHF